MHFKVSGGPRKASGYLKVLFWPLGMHFKVSGGSRRTSGHLKVLSKFFVLELAGLAGLAQMAARNTICQCMQHICSI